MLVSLQGGYCSWRAGYSEIVDVQWLLRFPIGGLRELNKLPQGTFTCRGTWDLHLGREVVESCQEVAIRMKNEQIWCIINSYGDSIHYLGLPDGIIDLVSVWRIC